MREDTQQQEEEEEYREGEEGKGINNRKRRTRGKNMRRLS